MDIADILSELDENGFTDTDLSTKVAKIQSAIWEIEQRKPWPFLEASIDLTFDGSSAVATNLPTNLRASLRVKDLTTGKRVMPVRLDDFEDFVGTEHSLAGDPEIYYFEGGQLKVWRIPPSTRTLKLRYLRWSDPITEASAESAILIPKQFHASAIVPTALSKLYLQEDDAELAAAYKGLADEQFTLMEEALFKQQYDRTDHVHVLDVDDLDSDGLYFF